MLRTDLTQLLGIEHPIMCAGMGFFVTGPDLAAAVSNAGGIGTIGAVGLNPAGLRQVIRELKAKLSPGKPYGVDLLLPADPRENPNARKTNKDYSGGQLEALVQVMVDEKVPLFVCAVGVPPRWVSDKLHQSGTVIMNMIGHPSHVAKAIKAGCDIICAQGTEAGGHTGDIATTVLVPMAVDSCKGHKNHFGSDVLVVAAGGIRDGRGVAAALALGASGVWMGTRFLMTPESNVEPRAKEILLKADFKTATMRTTAYTGRPCRVIKNEFVKRWESQPGARDKLLQSGVIPLAKDLMDDKVKPTAFYGLMGDGTGAPLRRKDDPKLNEIVDPKNSALLAGQSVMAIDALKPAGDLLHEIVAETDRVLRQVNSVRVAGVAKM
ncbi:hypothetical protein FOZ61_001500 [Perkinsus olseni]|uniref:Nitronate monooxygenase n=2 Tax=Perkinsus olseni TaxID=32597 RepID=A0A7J6LWP1_PEROL|nr:hypothetical protein FOZ61_001500 [Perkinsus olseni]KAF4669762.1 hypothetical protein FOL46_001235 [Perkinsus olseni]